MIRLYKLKLVSMGRCTMRSEPTDTESSGLIVLVETNKLFNCITSLIIQKSKFAYFEFLENLLFATCYLSADR